MKPLSERARERCERNILRYFPAWKQAQILFDGTDEDRDNMAEFVAIAEGHVPDIDDWPEYGVSPVDEPQPEVVIERVEVPVEVIKEVPIEVVKTVENPETEARLEAALAELEAGKQRVDEREPSLDYDISFVQEEQNEGEEIHQTYQRLKLEYEELNARRPLPIDEDTRRELLYRKLFFYKGR